MQTQKEDSVPFLLLFTFDKFSIIVSRKEIISSTTHTKMQIFKYNNDIAL